MTTKKQPYQMKTAEIVARREELMRSGRLVATNDGTFSPAEAGEKMGTSEPRSCVWEVVWYPDGSVWRHNRSAHDAGVGYARVFDRAKAQAKLDRAEYIELGNELARRAKRTA